MAPVDSAILRENTMLVSCKYQANRLNLCKCFQRNEFTPTHHAPPPSVGFGFTHVLVSQAFTLSSIFSVMSIRRISWVKVQRRSLKPTKIVVGAAVAHTPAAESRRGSYVSPVYGRLVESKETEDMCKRLGMSRDDVRVLRRKFDDEDGSHSDTVTVRGFFI